MRDSEWSVIRYFTPLIGGEPLVEGVKINIFAYYERMHRPILLKIPYYTKFVRHLIRAKNLKIARIK